MFLHDYLLACEISTVRTQTLKPVYSEFIQQQYQMTRQDACSREDGAG